MTDTTAGRGGVGIRVFIDGAQVVRRTFDQIGDSGKKMWAEIALGERSANPAIRALSMGAGEVKNALDGLASRAGSAGVALGAFGAAGVLAAAALGAVAVATHGAFDAMNRAADLTDAADRIGIGVEALQQWRYAADEAGVDVGKFEGALEKLNGALGKFKMGLGDAKLKPVFEELGITKEQLDGVNTADQLLLMLADTLGQVKDRAQQVALARALGVEDALPAIRLGRAELERLTGAASELGLVLSAETNAALDESQRKLEMANQQMRVARDVAVAPLADAYAAVAAELANMIVQYDRIETKGPGWMRALQGLGNAMPWSGGFQRYISNRIGGVEAPSGEIPMDGDDPALLRQRMAVTASQSGGGFDLKGHAAGAASSRANAAAAAARAAAAQAVREAEQRRQREERAQQQIERADEGVIRSRERQYGGELSIDGRALIETNEIQRERVKALREIKRAEDEYARSNGLRGLTEAEAEQLRLKQNELAEQRENVVETQRRRDLSARRLQDEEDAGRGAIELLDMDAQMVRTNQERVRIEREILLATIEIARKRKRAELENDPELSDDERRTRLAAFEQSAGRRVELFDHQESERLRAQFKGYGQEVVAAIEQGRIGEYIGDRIKAKLLDGALDQLFNLMKASSAGGASGGGWIQSAVNFASSIFGGGRAAGGDTQAGRFYTTVEHGRPELMMIGGNGHVTSAAETVRMLQESLAERGGGYGGGQAPILRQSNTFDFRGAVVTQDLLDQARAQSEAAAGAAFSSARATVPSDMARTSRYTRGRK